MSKTKCTQCGAPRVPLDKECPYCGCVYEDIFDVMESDYDEELRRRGILFESSAVKRWMLWSHTNCRLRITKDQLIFDDFEDDTYSFTIPMDALKRASLENPKGFLSSSDDMLIILEDGKAYEIGLDAGVKQRVLEVIQAIWERYY